ncbi:dynein axonemal assembly factor 5-like isoform X2 [Dysidea avara]
MPVLVARLGQQEITESSEELRLSMITMLTSFMDHCGAKVPPYLNDVVTILQRTLVDPYHEVKKESCNCCCKLAVSAPREFHMEAESLVKPILHSMGHQHSRVRVACIKALGVAIQHGSATSIDDALPQLAQRLCDQAPSVRASLSVTIGNWLLDLYDRYSYHHKLVPLLLTFFYDEVEEISKSSIEHWDKIGAKYEGENEKDLKDQMDFPQQPNCPAQLRFPLPRLGCRVIIQRNFSKILPALLRDLTDWTTNSRIKSSQLLYILLYHLEDHVTQHLQAVFSGLYRSAQDEEQIVVEQTMQCAELIGFYVNPEIWTSFVLPAVRTSAGCRREDGKRASDVTVGPVQSTSCVLVLAGLVRGATRTSIEPYFKNIVATLGEPEVTQTSHIPLLQQLLNCTEAVIHTAGPLCRQHSEAIFTILLRLQASSGDQQVLIEKGNNIKTQFAKEQELSDSVLLYQLHSKEILSKLKDSYTSWSSLSPDCLLFGCLLAGASSVVIGESLEDIIPMLTHCLRPEEDAKMKLNFFTLLIEVILNAAKTMNEVGQQFSSFTTLVVSDIIIPNCVWRAGRTAGAIRTAAVTCLQALLQGSFLLENHIGKLLPDLQPRLISCLDDDIQSTRLVSCKVLRQLFALKSSNFNVDRLHSVCSDLLKRLDDSSDEIRLAMTKTLQAYFSSFPVDYNQMLYKAHTDMLYKSLLVHMDDPSPIIQGSVLEVLKEASRLNPSQLTDHVNSVRTKHRTTSYCDELLAYIHNSKS